MLMKSPEPPPTSYWQRRDVVASQAAGEWATPRIIDYRSVENDVWAQVSAALRVLWDRHASTEILGARCDLGLPADRVPQLAEVNAALSRCSDFSNRAVPGLVEREMFFAALARRVFLSTQYVRWERSPFYTAEPDVIHEVMGHGHALTVPGLAQLHRLAGEAMCRLHQPESKRFVANVFWFSGEFGVVRERSGWKAYGAGLLSSTGELDSFARRAEVVALDIRRMGTIPYDIGNYQPLLFGAMSLTEVLDTVGTFFETCSDQSIAELTCAR